jgi:hypothetical protein
MYEGKFFESFEIVEDRREQGKVYLHGDGVNLHKGWANTV